MGQIMEVYQEGCYEVDWGDEKTMPMLDVKVDQHVCDETGIRVKEYVPIEKEMADPAWVLYSPLVVTRNPYLGILPNIDGYDNGTQVRVVS